MATKNPQPKWLVVAAGSYSYNDMMTIVAAPSVEKAAEKVAKNNGYSTRKKTYTVYELGTTTKVEVTPVLDVKVKK